MFRRREFLGTAAAAAAHLIIPRQAKAEEVSVTGAYHPALAPFDTLFTKLLKDHAIPGAGVAVSRHGKLVYARGFGHANIESKSPVHPNSHFRLASVSKPITGTAVLRLVDMGKLKLEDPVLRHVRLEAFEHPRVKSDPRWEKITVHQCLQHTGGWDRDRKGGFDPIGIPWKIMEAMGLKRAPSPSDIVRYMMGLPLDFEPGARMSYSNLGYLVLGRVIEAVTGENYEKWVRKHVLAPVGAPGISLGRALPEDRPPQEVHYRDSKNRTGPCLYPPRFHQKVPLPDGAENMEGFEAHGGWVASAPDLLRFACSFDAGHQPAILSEEAVKTMWARPSGAAGYTRDKKPRETYYGCGWDVRPIDKAGAINVWHGGLISGASTLLVRRHDGLNWAVLFNVDSNPKQKPPADLIDGPMHEAADAVKKWPDIDIFGSV